MATIVVQATPTGTSAQTRTLRTTTPWPPPGGLMHSRPWRSSPLAGPAFSTLPPVILESSEEPYEGELHDIAQEHPHTRSLSSSSIASQTGSLSVSASGYTSRNASASASALLLVEGDASTSSVSLSGSTAAHGTSSSHSQYSSSQAHPNRPKHLSKSWRRRPSSAQGNYAAPKSVGDRSMASPRPRTVSHGHSRAASFPVQPVSSPRLAQPASGVNTTKQSPSVSRDPASNWMSSSPFGPAETPKFSRLAMASPAVIMPLSAREYRKQKNRESLGRGGRKEPPTSSNRVTFIDNAISAFQNPSSVPVVKVFPPTSEDVRLPTPSSDDHRSDRRSQLQPQVDHPPSKPLPQASMPPHPSSTKQKRPSSRPNTPPRSSPLAVHPSISPKSSAGTFFSFTDTSEDDTSRPHGGTDDPSIASVVPPARPRPRTRRKSYPDRLSNGPRLSLLEAVNRLSQEGASLHRLSSISQTDGVNRLSMASQLSGHTLFYDVESDVEQGQVTARNGNRHPDGHGGFQRTPVLHTQSLEDLCSTLARTGIEVVDGNSEDPLDGDERKGKRNVRTVRISDTVEVSPPVAPRRRKLTKSRPGPARGLTPVPEAGPVAMPGIVKEVKVQTPAQTHERLASLLPWKSKGSSNSKAGRIGRFPGAAAPTGERDVLTPTKGLVHPNETTPPAPVPNSASLIAGRSAHAESISKPIVNGSSKKLSFGASPTATSPDPASKTHKSRRYTFSFLPSATFHRPKREKSHTAPPNVDLGLDRNTQGQSKDRIKKVESGTDSTSTSIRTITQSTQSTLVPAYDLPFPGSSVNLSGSSRGSRSSVPMLRRLTAQEMTTASMVLPNKWEGKGDSTPSLITTESTTTSSSSPRTPSIVRLAGSGGPFVPRPSGLKESYTDTSEEDSEGEPGGRKSRMCAHRKQEPSPLTCGGTGWGETSEGDERHLRPNAGALPGSRPGTASSTATETSGSYLSFSTVPASTTSSSSTSRSESPAPTAGDKLGRVLSMAQDRNGDEVMHACALCGHRLPSPSSLPMRQPDLLGDMHPMFTVPLVTVPASNTGKHPCSSSNAPSATQTQGGDDLGTRGARYTNQRKSERHAPVPAPAAASIGAATPARPNQGPNHMPVHANWPPATSNKVDKMTPSLSSPKARQQRRPQTAPAGAGNAAFKLIEDTKTMRAREGSVDALAVVDCPAKYKSRDKAGARESRFKVVLKGLLKWSG